jgi:hypothetical protein
VLNKKKNRQQRKPNQTNDKEQGDDRMMNRTTLHFNCSLLFVSEPIPFFV